MIKVMIVDDEYLLRNLIKNAIDWQELGFEIIAEAADGEEALKKVEEHRPQLIILDINIPFINGLVFSQSIRERYHDIKIIILTGYSEFKYAQEAIKQGVLCYIVKPIETDEFLKAVQYAKDEIIRQSEQKNYINKLEKRIEDSSKVLKENFLNSLLDGSEELDNEKIREKMEYFRLGLKEENLLAFIIEIDNFEERWNQSKDRELWLFALSNMVEEIFAGYNSFTTFKEEGGCLVVLANIIRKDTEIAENKSYIEICQKIMAVVKNYLGFTITIGIGQCCQRFADIRQSFTMAEAALENKFYEGSGKVFQYEITGTRPSMEANKVVIDEDSLMINQRIGDFDVVKSQIDGYFTYIYENRIPKYNVELAVIELIACASEFLNENNIKVPETIRTNKSILESIRKREVISDLKDWVLGVFEESIGLVNENRKKGALIVVEKAKKYIEENYYKKGLYLDEIAENIFVSPSYISNVFKRELGCSIIEYLTEHRMKKAKLLMDGNPELQIAEVAEQIGYDDPYYFSKCFKKYYGVSPTRYRTRI